MAPSTSKVLEFRVPFQLPVEGLRCSCTRLISSYHLAMLVIQQRFVDIAQLLQTKPWLKSQVSRVIRERDCYYDVTR